MVHGGEAAVKALTAGDDLVLIAIRERAASSGGTPRGRVLLEPGLHIPAAPLAYVSLSRWPEDPGCVERTCCRAHVQHAQQAGKGIGVAAVRCGGQKQEMPHAVCIGHSLGCLPRIPSRAAGSAPQCPAEAICDIVILGVQDESNLGQRVVVYDQVRMLRLQILVESYTDTYGRTERRLAA